jgi:hypothetical protein
VLDRSGSDQEVAVGKRRGGAACELKEER